MSPATRERLTAPLGSGEFIVFDIETTGGNPEKNGITEIFALRWKDGQTHDTFYSLVNPGIPIPPIVRRMTGIDNKMVRGAPRIDAVMPDFVKFVGGAILVSHNTIGDMKFVRYFAKQTADVDMENFYLCTHLLVEKLAPEAPDKSLKGLAEYFDLARGELHRAEADAYVTLELFKVLLGRLGAKEVKRIDEAVRLQGDLESALRLGWGVSHKALDDVPPGPGVFYLYDHQHRLIFLSSALQLDREVAKLRSLNQLPRQLIRLVLRAYDLEVRRSPNGYAALLLECDALRDHDVAIPPVNWHQRTVQTLFVAADKNGIRIGVGPLEPGAKHAFGPVRDRRIAGELIDEIGRVFGVQAGRDGLVLPAETEPLVLGLLLGTLGAEVQAANRAAKAIKLWFKPTERKKHLQRLHMLKQLAAVNVPPRLLPMLDRAGILALPGAETGTWEAYTLAGSRPRQVTTLRASSDAELRAACLELVKSVPNDPPKALDRDEVNRANVTLWWLSNGKGEGRFQPAPQDPSASKDGQISQS